MSVWHVTEADRDEQGKIRTLADLLPKLEEEETQQVERPRWRVTRLEAAGIAAGLVLAVALIAGMNVFLPARAPRLTSPTAVPAATFTIVNTPTRTSTPAPTATATQEPPTATPEPPPTLEPQVIYVEPPCDPTVNPRYSVELDVSPYGRVRGVSCDSLEDASANAEALRAAMLATAGAP